MSSRNASRLEAGLIARKGEAAPAQNSSQPVSVAIGEQVDRAARAEPPGQAPSRQPRGIQGTIAVTVRLDPDRYERMKIHGARCRLTNQDILVEALDRYFAALTD